MGSISNLRSQGRLILFKGPEMKLVEQFLHLPRNAAEEIFKKALREAEADSACFVPDDGSSPLYWTKYDCCDSLASSVEVESYRPTSGSFYGVSGAESKLRSRLMGMRQ